MRMFLGRFVSDRDYIIEYIRAARPAVLSLTKVVARKLASDGVFRCEGFSVPVKIVPEDRPVPYSKIRQMAKLGGDWPL